jgi:large subunit ribosomal protein L24
VKLHKGDRVKVLSGKDRGREGDVMRVLPKANKVIVDGVNVAKRHTRATKATMQGGIIDKDMPIAASAVAIICPNDGATRIGYRLDGVGGKIRICKKCGTELPTKEA